MPSSPPASFVEEANKPKNRLKTTPVDPRFPNTNQAQNCWTKYNTWVLCLKKNDGDEDSCKTYRQYARSICPDEWVDRWDTERDEGNFAGIQL